jgi:hypothetical protein
MNPLFTRLLQMAAATTTMLPLLAGAALATPERCAVYAGDPLGYHFCLQIAANQINHDLTMDYERLKAEVLKRKLEHNGEQYDKDRALKDKLDRREKNTMIVLTWMKNWNSGSDSEMDLSSEGT